MASLLSRRRSRNASSSRNRLDRDRIASPAEAALLIAAMQPRDQAALGFAVYAGLRLGELLALDVSAVDLEGGWIHALSTYLGHATITITLDRYGHLMPGSEVEARAMLDAYLDRPEG